MLNIIFLILGILIGYFLHKERIKESSLKFQDKIKTILIKPQGTVGDSKEVNSLNKITDDVNYVHNDYFDEPNEIR